MTTVLLRVLVVLLGAASPAAAETINAQYLIYAGGFKALALDARADVADERYAVRGLLKTQGIVDWILNLSQTLEAQGRIDGGVLPQSFVSDGVFWRSHRATRLAYDDDRRVKVTLVPSNEEDNDRPKVPDELTIGTVDPLGAYVAAAVAARAGSPCQSIIPVFDGRRRYNVVLEEDGIGVVEPSSYSNFSGPALRCKFSQDRLGGFQRNPRFDPRTPRISILYLARFGESGLWLPVRLETESSFGNVVGHLVRIDAPVRPLGRSMRPAS
jgi:hypothetical protein